MDVLEILYDYFEDRPHAAALIRQRRPAPRFSDRRESDSAPRARAVPYAPRR